MLSAYIAREFILLRVSSSRFVPQRLYPLTRRDQYHVPENSYGDVYHKKPRTFPLFRPLKRFAYRYPQLVYYYIPLTCVILILFGSIPLYLIRSTFGIGKQVEPMSNAQANARLREVFSYGKDLQVPHTGIKFSMFSKEMERYLEERDRFEEEERFREMLKEWDEGEK